MEGRRMFLAVNLPEKTKKEIYSKFCERAGRPGLKIVEEKNLHITMKFFGYLGEGKLKEIIKQLSGLGKRGGFTAGVGKIGHFGGRVIWLGIGKGSGKFIGLAAEIDRLLGIGGKKLHPHITIARNKKLTRKEAIAVVGELQKESYEGSFEVGSVDLMESKPSSEGPEYLVVEKFELG